MASSGDYRKVYLACRNAARAEVAKKDLEQVTGKPVFEIIIMDLSDVASVRAASASLDEAIDDLVMNAGGPGGKAPMALTRDGVTTVFATNVLGHVVLLEGLIQAGQLRGAAVFAGSEAARGIPMLGMKRPVLATSSADEFASLCDGTYFRDRKVDISSVYGQIKYVGAMWMAAMAPRHPGLRLVTMSPGSTRGTEGPNDLPLPLRLMMRYVMIPVVLPLFGMVHDLEQGAKRLIDGLNDDTLRSGAFYASKAGALTGPVIDQGEIFPDLWNPTYQDNALEAVHRFTGSPGPNGRP